MIKLQLDYTLFIQIIQFIIINFIVAKFVVIPIKKNMDARNGKIDSLNSSAKSSISEMESKRAEYEDRLVAANKELAEYRSGLTKAASSKAKVMIDDIQNEVKDELEKARQFIQQETDKARKELKTQINDMSKQIIEAISN